MNGKLISANEVIKYTVLAGEIRNQYMEVVPAYFVREAPAVDAVEVDKVAQMFYEFTGDDCPCNYNDNDEWLWDFCDGDHCPGEGLECWKLFVKHYGGRKERRE